MATSTTPQPDAADPPKIPPRAWTLTSVPGLNVCLPSRLTLEMCFERLTVVIFVEFDADAENRPVTARCEPGRLAWTVVKPFAHCRHFGSQIGCRHPDCDRAHVHPPSFVKRMPTPEDLH